MTTSHAPDFHVNRPAALIAALPAVLGFAPENSLVLVTVEHGQLGCVMRVDLDAARAQRVDGVAEVAAAAGPDAAIAVIVDAEGACCAGCDDDYRELAAALASILTSTASSCSPCTSWTESRPGAAGTAPTDVAPAVRSTTRRRRRWRWPRCSTGAGSTPVAATSPR